MTGLAFSGGGGFNEAIATHIQSSRPKSVFADLRRPSHTTNARERTDTAAGLCKLGVLKNGF
jgi:hypothetical protein